MMEAPPVGPWRWVILLVRAGICFVSYGIFKSMGVFVDEFVEYFECTTRAAGLTVSLPFTIGNVTGIFTGVLLRTFGARPLMIFSGAVFAVSLIASSVVSQSLVHIALCFIVCIKRPGTRLPDYKPIADGVPSSTTTPPPNESLCNNWRQKFRTICEKLDLQMFVDEPGFVTTQIVNFLFGIVSFGWHIYLVPHGIALGFNKTRSSFLATFGGFGAVIGRFSSGFLIDRGLLQAKNIFAGSSFLLALVCLLDPIASSSYEAVATIATLAGFCFGVLFPITIVLSVSFPEERRVSALAWMFAFSGSGLSAGGFLFGWIYDMTGDYGVNYCTMGVFSVVMGALALTLRRACFPCQTRDRE